MLSSSGIESIVQLLNINNIAANEQWAIPILSLQMIAKSTGISPLYEGYVSALLDKTFR